jgi:hypothetical protein
MDDWQGWYVVQQLEGDCEIVEKSQCLIGLPMDAEKLGCRKRDAEKLVCQRWGPYESNQAAIAYRVGLIRAGKCKPISNIPFHKI